MHGASVLAAIEVWRAQGLHQEPQREDLLHGREIAGEGADALAVDALDPRRDRRERLGPGRGAQSPAVADVGLVEALQAQAVDDLPGLVGDPLLVDRLVDPRLDAHHLAAAGVDPDCRADRVHHVDASRSSTAPTGRML